MDTPQHLEKIEKVAVKEEEKEEEKSKEEEEHPRPTNTISSGSLPPSSSSSPSHEFSFTISLQPSNKCKPAPSFEVDLSPADDIFFHGHLLPLHLLSDPSIAPRSSTSLDYLNLPIRNIFDDQKLQNNSSSRSNDCKNNSSDNNKNNDSNEMNGTSNPKSFSLSRLAKWRKAFEIGERREEKKKARFDVSRVIKRYARAVKPFLSFNSGNKEKCETRRQPYSFSGTLNSKWKEWGGRRAGEFSAPASMWTSPTNSGLLVATATISSSNDSTMEELQNAIQAAIAHCKNSIAVKEEKCKC